MLKALCWEGWQPKLLKSLEETQTTYAPHIDTGDHVIVINADKVVLTSGKAERKIVYRHTGFPGGIKSDSYEELLAKKPADIVRQSIRGMIPKTRLGRQQLSKLANYAGPSHTRHRSQLH